MSASVPVPRTRRLALRIYLVTLAVIVAIVAALGVLRRYLYEPTWRSGRQQMARYAVASVAALRGDPRAMADEARRIREELDAALTLYGADGTLLVSNLDPPLPPLEAVARAQVLGGATLDGADAPGMAVPVRQDGAVVAYGLYDRPRPQMRPEKSVLVVVAALVVAAVAAALLARSLASPLARLAAMARRFGGGDLGVRARWRRRDELGDLAHAFDEMADRIAALLRSQNELLANVSHELRTPLSRIRVALDLAAGGDAELARESLAEIAEDLGELEQPGDAVLATVRLDLAAGRATGAQPLRVAPVDLGALVERAATRFRTAYPRHVLEVATDGPPALEGDAALLRRALENLLDNACKYSEPGSAVRLGVTCESGSTCIEVADQGIGIDAADLPQLFTPFFRSDRSRARTTGGVGLGLVLVRRIAEAHGGQITVDSRPGTGTVARLRLPPRPPGADGAAPLGVHQLPQGTTS